MYKKILLFLALLCVKNTFAQTLYFPPVSGNSWDTISPESLGWCRDKMAPMFQFLEARNTKAFLVLKDGKIVIEKYFGKFTKDSIWYWASAGKTLTAFAVGMAQDDGFLKISDTSSKYLGKGWTNCTQTQESKINIRHQLTMTTGLNDAVSDNHCTLDTCLNYKADAGSRWAYHNGAYTMLDKVIENSTGKNINSYLNSKLKSVTGMSGLFIKLDYDNVYFSTARSMARFGLLMLNKGDWGTIKVLKDKIYFNQMINTSQNLNNSYGYLWWLNGKTNFMAPGLQLIIPGSLNPNSPVDMYSAMGKNGQFLNVIPSQNLIVIRLGNAPNSSEVPFLMNDTIFIKLKAVMCQSSSIKNEWKEGSHLLKLYPNPVNDIIHVEGNSFIKKIAIINTQGQKLMESHFDEDRLTQKMDVSDLPCGLYFTACYTDKGAIKPQYFIKN
jgi:CubicO group peptidase (beta-lactamase class C family)